MFVPLRVHGHHSLLTGTDAPRALLARASALGMPALALTDVDTLSGIVDFLQAARDLEERAQHDPAVNAVRPILGAELSDPAGLPGRLVVLARDEAGFKNLCKLVSARQLGRDPGEHGADLPGAEHFDLVREVVAHQAGLVFVADHPRLLLALFGRVDPRWLFAGVSLAALRASARGGRRREDRARDGELRNAHLLTPRRAARTDALEANDEEPELEAPKTPPPEPAVSAVELVEAARATGAATLALPDVYCARAEGYADHRVRVAIKHNALLEGLPERWLAERPAHLLEPEELRERYAGLPEVAGAWTDLDPGDWPAAGADAPGCVLRTLAVADACRYTPPLGLTFLPDIELAPNETAYSRLCALSFEGLNRRYRPLRPEIVRRLDYELDTIDRLGFAAYFLLVKRLADFARDEGIPSVGRGSAADSLVAYALGLTEADPFRYKLPFERFLNPARQDRPDIDLDFCWRRRDEVLEHVYELFGAERTAMICTLNSFGLRSAFREAALVAGLPPAEVSKLTRFLPYAFGGGGHFDGETTVEAEAPPAPDELDENPVALAFRRTPEARGFPFEDARYREILRAAAALIDTPRHYGLHPGGVVVAPGPITDFVSCQRAAKGVVVTQLDKDAVEAVGLVKMDLLGNRALTVVDDCVKELARHGVEVDPLAVPEDDPQTAATLREGRTLGCFQIESPGMRNLLKQTGAATMDDVIQAVALIRPGPAGSGMKDAYVRRFRGLEPREAPHPRLTEVLWDTYGVMLYQEDVMQAASQLAGMDLAEADQLRRALQKRRMDELRPLFERYLAGCARQGVPREEAEPVWELIANFASFAFCKAHAITYGQIAYRAAWLKTHHPALFLWAFLESETGYYATRVYIEEARRLGVAILAPDINRSRRGFSVEWRGGRAALRVGLGRVKGLTQKTLARALEQREAGGPFLALPDFLERCAPRTDETETLIQVGAFDAFDRTRPELLWRLHLLRTPQQRVPKTPGLGLDMAQLGACRETPTDRARASVRRASTGGWGQSGIGGVDPGNLAPGESALLFPEPETPGVVLPGLPDVDPETRGALEFELLGLTVDRHPTRLFPCPADERLARAGRRPPNPTPCGRLERFVGGRITLRGWPAATRRVRTSDDRWMRFLTLEDESGIAEVVVWPDVYERDGHHLAEFGSLCVTGIVQDQMGACTLEAERIW